MYYLLCIFPFLFYCSINNIFFNEVQVPSISKKVVMDRVPEIGFLGDFLQLFARSLSYFSRVPKSKHFDWSILPKPETIVITSKNHIIIIIIFSLAIKNSIEDLFPSHRLSKNNLEIMCVLKCTC